jgi:hypothetical protein
MEHRRTPWVRNENFRGRIRKTSRVSPDFPLMAAHRCAISRCLQRRDQAAAMVEECAVTAWGLGAPGIIKGDSRFAFRAQPAASTASASFAQSGSQGAGRCVTGVPRGVRGALARVWPIRHPAAPSPVSLRRESSPITAGSRRARHCVLHPRPRIRHRHVRFP